MRSRSFPAISSRALLTGIILVSVPFLYGDRGGTVRGESSEDGTVQAGEEPSFQDELFRLEEDLVLGIDEGEPAWQIFGRRIWFALNPEGRIYLLDMPDNTFHIISPSGELLGEFGRSGSGPGEFDMPAEMFWIETIGEFWVNDRRLTRISRFSQDGELIDTINYSLYQRTWAILYYLGEQRFLAMQSSRGSVPGENVNHYGLLNDDMSWSRELFSAPGQRNWQISENGGWVPLPFLGMTRIVTSAKGIIVVGHPDDGRIEVYDADGNRQRIIELEWERIRILREEKERVLERFRSMPSIERSRINNLNLPDFRTAFFTIQLDDQGRIWVERCRSWPQETPPVYELFTLEGEWLGTQSMEFRPAHIQDGYVYDVPMSEEHGPRLIRYRLVPLHRGLGDN